MARKKGKKGKSEDAPEQSSSAQQQTGAGPSGQQIGQASTPQQPASGSTSQQQHGPRQQQPQQATEAQSQRGFGRGRAPPTSEQQQLRGPQKARDPQMGPPGFAQPTSFPHMPQQYQTAQHQPQQPQRGFQQEAGHTQRGKKGKSKGAPEQSSSAQQQTGAGPSGQQIGQASTPQQPSSGPTSQQQHGPRQQQPQQATEAQSQRGFGRGHAPPTSEQQQLRGPQKARDPPRQPPQMGPPGFAQPHMPQQYQTAQHQPQQPQRGFQQEAGHTQRGYIQQGGIPQTTQQLPHLPPQQEPPKISFGQGDGPGSVSPQKQQPQKGQQKGKQKGQQQQGPTEQRASTSHAPPSSELSRLRISKTEADQGDSQILPMNFVRAKPGIKGRKIPIETNHLALNLGNLKKAYHYDVNIDPDTPKKFLRPVMEMFRQLHYKNQHPAFDGRKNLYTTKPLPSDTISGEIDYKENESGRVKKYKIEVKFANEVDLEPLHDFLKCKETPREALQVVDIVLRSAPPDDCIRAGRSFFVKPERLIDLEEGMEMYNGFYQSAVRGWKPFLNVDVAHKAFPKNAPVIAILKDLLSDYRYKYTDDDLRRGINNQARDVLQSFIKTLRVSYGVHGDKKVEYRVNGLDEPAETKTFTADDGKVMTIQQYFKAKKNYTIQFPKLPTLWVGSQKSEKKILLPLELCTVMAGQVTNRKMTETQTSNMIKYAATSTQIRKEKIMTSLKRANHNNHPTTMEFRFSVAGMFEQLDARVLDPPHLVYAEKRLTLPERGVWRGDKFVNGVTINNWTIMSVARGTRPDELTKVADMIYRFGQSCGMIFTAGAEKPYQNVRPQLDDLKRYFQTQKQKNFDVIFVIVPNKGKEYSYVKTAAELNVGCLTQCIKARTLSRMNPQTATNILLKVNSKLNGTNHYLLSGPPIMKVPCMIMGADVTHPSPDSRNIPSVAAVTASHDRYAFQYNICWRLQDPRVEIIADLEEIVKEQINYFKDKNKVLPKRIIFFRDGVSEGQFDQVRHSEINAIIRACKKIQADYRPLITFLVVQKRHHTRLFPRNPRDSHDKNCNVPAGTCVDTVITHPFMQDFYLVSHASIQGVAKPTKYCTLLDDNNLTNDDIEELTYHLCHMFTRCNRSVSYPAPTYYAHLAAARAKVYIENVTLNMDQLDKEYIKFQIRDDIRKGKPMFFV